MNQSKINEEFESMRYKPNFRFVQTKSKNFTTKFTLEDKEVIRDTANNIINMTEKSDINRRDTEDQEITENYINEEAPTVIVKENPEVVLTVKEYPEAQINENSKAHSEGKSIQDTASVKEDPQAQLQNINENSKSENVEEDYSMNVGTNKHFYTDDALVEKVHEERANEARIDFSKHKLQVETLGIIEVYHDGIPNTTKQISESLRSQSVLVNCIICRTPAPTKTKSYCSFINSLLCIFLTVFWASYMCLRRKDWNCYNTDHNCGKCGNYIDTYTAC
jgi:hypothetical protein